MSWLILLLAFPASADIEIHKCVDADGNVAYQQTPCPVIEEQVDETASPEQGLPSEEQPGQTPVASNRSEDEIEACKDPLRDAIDEIEAEMLRGFSPQQAEAFKAKLRTLTQEMRACG
jgi:hypothetical protein